MSDPMVTYLRGIAASARQSLEVPDPQWKNYTPTWSSSSDPQPSLGDGTLTGQYLTTGHLCVARGYLLAGGTTTFGTGYWRVSVPLSALNYGYALGMWRANNAGVANYGGVAVFVSATNLYCVVSGSTYITPTNPFTSGSGDSLLWQISYEI